MKVAFPKHLGRTDGGLKRPSAGPVRLGTRLASVAILAVLGLQPLVAQSMKVEVSGLSDVNFGQISDFQSDLRQAQSVCVAANSSGLRYSVQASGSGAGGAFALSNGVYDLPYSVEWSAGPGQNSGIALSASSPLTAQRTSERGPRCKDGPTASLVVVLRASETSRAQQGNYSGSLTLLISPE